MDAQLSVDESLSPMHCRAGRSLLGWTQEELAAAAGVGRVTVRKVEAEEPVRRAQIAAIRHALEKAGVAFFLDVEVAGNSISVGVGLVSSQKA